MKGLEKATVEVYHFECKDIITTSDEEHDNGYIDGDILARKAKELIDKIF